MAVYEYQCEVCGKIKEIVAKHNERPIAISCTCMNAFNIHGLMRPIISSSTFVINGYSEANGYSKKQ